MPEGVFQTLLVGSDRVAGGHRATGASRAVTLTGSEGAGARRWRGRAGDSRRRPGAGRQRPVHRLADADLDAAAATAVKARTINTGQSCIAAKRFIVHESIADAVRATVRRGHGGAAKSATRWTANARSGRSPRRDRRRAGGQVEKSVAAGAPLLLGGQRLPGPGQLLRPDRARRTSARQPAVDEEMFGPVAAVFRVAEPRRKRSRSPTRTRFGLGAQPGRATDAERTGSSREIEAGCVFVNGMVKSDPRLPFGGVKQSGYGRELGGDGIREFVNVKTVWIG